MSESPPALQNRPRVSGRIVDLLLVLVLLTGAYFRFVGMNWDEGLYLHPDERFLYMVESSIQPIQSLGEYFDTAVSSLNPHNRGHGFFVYGTLPIFLVRYVAEWLGETSYGQVHMIGRPISALVDLATVVLVYLVAVRLYDRRVGLLAAAFAAFSVLHIQLAHFFKEDTFMTFFTFLALYFAVRVARGGTGNPRPAGNPLASAATVGETTLATPAREKGASLNFRHQWVDFVLFGMALGMAVSSKLNAGLVAGLLPLAVLIRMSNLTSDEQPRALPEALGYMVLAAAVSLLTFRVFQPYAFLGPDLLDWRLNPQWLDNIRALRTQASPAAIYTFPPGLQWAERPIWFSWVNMVRWGFGIPLGLLVWFGFLWMGWRVLRGEWRLHGVMWIWAAVYFGWQTSLFNPTMRYLLPVYPAFAIFGGWAVVALWDRGAERLARSPGAPRPGLTRGFALAIGGLALVSAFAWSFAFTRIYTQPVTRAEASRWILRNIPGPINLRIQTDKGMHQQPLPFPPGYLITSDAPLIRPFTPLEDGRLEEVSLNRVADRQGAPGVETLTLLVADNPDREPVLTQASFAADFPMEGMKDSVTLTLDPPLRIEKGRTYYLQLALDPQSGGAVSMTGAALANETSWDDGLPLRVDGIDPYGGIYQGGLNLEMYWEDNQDKLERFLSTLEAADYILITSSRQWASVGRLPDRYPLSTAYYRALLGCPEDISVEACYIRAETGMFTGQLGFDLVKVVTSHPKLGPWRINDQPAEEAFTVYDHPKVFVLRKDANYDSRQVAAFLEGIYRSYADAGAPVGVQGAEKTLLLPSDRLVTQRQGGTWVQLFNPQSLINRSQLLSVVAWYLALGLLGLAAYPIVRAALPGLRDHGYPVARLVGLLLLSYIPWLAGSFGVSFTRLTILLSGLLIALLGGLFAYRSRTGFRAEWNAHRRYYLLVEGLFLAFFLLGLFIRLGNPDLWHPWKGGEKPMDFSYFNAVLKSTTFPPYDPWYAGGYINYYYYGFVLVGVLVKALGIMPAVAYNLILPSLFAMIAMGAFSFGWNLIGARESGESTTPQRKMSQDQRSWWVGLAAAFGMVVLGNLGSLRMIYRGYQALASPGVDLDAAGFLTRMIWALEGFFKSLAGTPLPYALGDWYWNPSRVIRPETGNPITEFPFFTFLYADLHAHLIALPLTVLVLLWALSAIRSRARWGGLAAGAAGFLVGGMTVGALRATNTWDFYPYLALASLALGYALWRGYRALPPPILSGFPPWAAAPLVALAGVAALVGLAHGLYQPFAQWYAQGYSQVDIWRHGHTPTSDYLTHWGAFLFVLVTWMAWETRQWMAATPLSYLRRLAPYRWLIQGALAMLAAWIAVLVWQEVHIAWLVLPLAAWAGVLLLRPGIPEARRMILFLAGTALVLTLMVEVIVLQGDIGRMNTVFKFYLQAWTLFALSSAGAVGWLLADLALWSPGYRRAWSATMAVLVASAALYPFLGGMAKIKDRMAAEAPHTLDGTRYMAFATYNDLGTTMDLNEDYRAIRWLQETVPGSPVIVEANSLNLYHWFSRMTINTGLPGVVGWDWHQRQQRAFVEASNVTGRVHEIDQFYTTEDIAWAVDFLDRYEVAYIVLGQLEKASYAGPGLDKFAAFDGVYWRQEYQDGQTAIFRVLQERSLGVSP